MRRVKPSKPLLPGEHVEITGHCGARDEDGEVPSVEMRGYRGRVCSNNAHYVNDKGVPMVGLRLGDNGQAGLVAVPRAAIRSTRHRSYFRIAADVWDRIFQQGA